MKINLTTRKEGLGKQMKIYEKKRNDEKAWNIIRHNYKMNSSLDSSV